MWPVIASQTVHESFFRGSTCTKFKIAISTGKGLKMVHMSAISNLSVSLHNLPTKYTSPKIWTRSRMLDLIGNLVFKGSKGVQPIEICTHCSAIPHD